MLFSWSLLHLVPMLIMVELHLLSDIRLQAVALNQLSTEKAINFLTFTPRPANCFSIVASNWQSVELFIWQHGLPAEHF
jgi:hypothetical protein